MEEGDKKLLALARELESLFFQARIRWDTDGPFLNDILVPVVVVFTKYDVLVLAKLCDEDEEMDEETLQAMSEVKASKTIVTECVKSLDNLVVGLKIPYVAVSGTSC